jgi:hypothetical protein
MTTLRWTPVLAIVAGCGSPTGLGVDLTDFERIPSIEALSFSAMQPAAEWDYWELRRGGWGGSDAIVGSGGAVERDALPDDVVAALDSLAPESGFGTSCLPGHCFSYIAAVRDGVVTTVLTVDELGAFLGELETVDEAVLLVHALSYYWDDGQSTGFRAVPGMGWELVVFELVAICSPVQTDRVLLGVHKAGTVAVRRRAVWEKLDGACI